MVLGTEVTCPWHDAAFDVTSGSVLGPLRRKTSPTITSESKAWTSKSTSKESLSPEHENNQTFTPPTKTTSTTGQIRDPLVLTNPRPHAPNTSRQIRDPLQHAHRPSDRTPSVLPSSPEVIPCQHPHVTRNSQARTYHAKNESGGEPMNSLSNAVVNRGRHSTTGFKLKKKFFGPKGTPLSTKHRKNLSPPVTLQRSSLTATRGYFQFVNIPEKPDCRVQLFDLERAGGSLGMRPMAPATIRFQAFHVGCRYCSRLAFVLC